MNLVIVCLSCDCAEIYDKDIRLVYTRPGE